MATIREVNIMFAEDRTTIGSTLDNTGAILKIRIVPNIAGTTIESIDFSYDGQHCGQVTDYEVFNSLTLSVKNNGETLIERVSNYLNQLSTEEFDVIVRQYSLYIEDGIIVDGIIAGIAAYLCLLWLNEHHFTVLCPFSFLTPADIHSGNSINRQMFRTLAVPLTALTRTNNRVMTQLASFVTTFINIWEPLFIEGPIIPESNDILVAIDIIAQLTEHVALTMDQQTATITEQLTNKITNQLLPQLTKEITTQVLTTVEHKINELIKTNSNTAGTNNISKYYPDSSEIIYERSQIQLSSKSEKDNFTNVIARRNNNNTAGATNIQSTGRLSSPLPWRK